MLPTNHLSYQNSHLHIHHQCLCHSSSSSRSRAQKLSRPGTRQQRARSGIELSVTAIQIQERRSNINAEAPSRHESEEELPSTSGSRRVAVLRAQKSAALALREGPRPLGNISRPVKHLDRVSDQCCWVCELQIQMSYGLTLVWCRLHAAEYMALPASQYSVLDAKRIERIDDDTFRCYVGGLKLFNFSIDPVLTVSVIVTERGPTVKLLSTKVSIALHCFISNVWFKTHCLLNTHSMIICL